ncbi:hypothetical protein NKI25_30665 [Mesorhizobium sp. M0808]|uniref:hypothetical protein n=1 Tax=Mesorhizobium sp. M0808 TaxID=2957002 RepID=UPI003336C0D7
MRRHRIAIRAHQHFEEIHPGRMNADQDLAGLRLRLRHRDYVENVGPAEAAQLNGSHRMHRSLLASAAVCHYLPGFDYTPICPLLTGR